jgi:hypothetical protein
MAFRRTTWIAAVAGAGVVFGYSVGRASSSFPSQQNAPVIFSGQVSSAGTPLSGTHQLAMNLWGATDTSVASNRVCQGTTQDVAVDNGNFQLPLDPTCVSALSQHTQIWHQLVVDGTVFPLQQIGSVPYALRSMQEPSNGTRLVTRRTVLYGEDGFRGPATYGASTWGGPTLTDTLRNEECAPTKTSSGGVQALHCLPPVILMGPGDVVDPYIFSDSACTTPYPPSTPTLRYAVGGCCNPFPYAADLDAADAVTVVYPITSHTTGSAYVKSASPPFCVPYPGTYVVWQYTLGAAIPLTDFVRMETVTE